MPLQIVVMADESICFYDRTLDVYPSSMAELVIMTGSELVGKPLINPITSEGWFDFNFKGEGFSVHNPYGGIDFWFFCNNPECNRGLLIDFVEKFEKVLTEVGLDGSQ